MSYESLPSRRVITGDLIALATEGAFDVIVHGCNCQRTMGGGIALAIKQAFPEAYDVDLRHPGSPASRLGTISFATVTRGAHSFTIVNAYTQLTWRGTGVLVDYAAVRSCFGLVRKHFCGARIGYPLIGAGLARGDWHRIDAIICDELSGVEHQLVTLPQQRRTPSS